MLSKEAFYKMKNGVRILTLARGELVSDDDILDAIEAGKVACYVTDFPNGKLAGKNKVIAIPHLGASTPESEDNCAYMAAREIIEYVENGNITNSVNMPTANMPRTGDNRICIIHKNIPEMITKISTIVSSKGLNIENMVNAGAKNRKYAYTMLDVATDVDDSIAEEFKAIDGIIRVRVLK